MYNDIILCIITCNPKDDKNIENNIELFNKNIGGKVYIHYNSESAHSFENTTTIITDHKIGMINARKKLIESISDEYNDNYVIWLDADDKLNTDNLIKFLDLGIYKRTECTINNSVYHWARLAKLSIIKRVYSYIPYTKFNFNHREDTIYWYILLFGLHIPTYPYDIQYTEYSGYHGYESSSVERDNIEKLVIVYLTFIMWKVDKLKYLSDNLLLEFLDYPYNTKLLSKEDKVVFKDTVLDLVNNKYLALIPKKYHEATVKFFNELVKVEC